MRHRSLKEEEHAMPEHLVRVRMKLKPGDRLGFQDTVRAMRGREGYYIGPSNAQGYVRVKTTDNGEELIVPSIECELLS